MGSSTCHYRLGEGERDHIIMYLCPQYGSGSHSNMDTLAQAIADNSMDTTQYSGSGWSSSYPTPPSTGGSRLSVSNDMVCGVELGRGLELL